MHPFHCCVCSECDAQSNSRPWVSMELASNQWATASSDSIVTGISSKWCPRVGRMWFNWKALEYIITLPDNDSVVRYLALQNMLQCLQGFQGQGFPFFEKKFLNAITVLVRPAIRSLALEAALMTSPLKTEWAGLLANSSSVQAMLPINQNSIPARWLGACTTCLRDPWNHQCS